MALYLICRLSFVPSCIRNTYPSAPLAHWEMIATMIFKLTQGATISDIRAADYGGHYAIWGNAIRKTHTQ
jgi:hypothetical protein